MATISPETLAGRLRGDTDLVIVDIRSEDDFEDWHIPNSTQIDVYDALRENPEEAKTAFRDLPKDAEIVTVCGIGMVSQTATDVLSDMGCDTLTLKEGMVGWSQVHVAAEVPIDISGTLVQVARPGKGCLSYVLISDGEAAVFDPSQYVSEYEAVLEDYNAELVGVYETHAHADHLSGGRALAERLDVSYHLHADDAIAIDTVPIEDGDTIQIGEVAVEAVHTPGHSPGGVTYDIDGEALLTGDTLFHGSVGRVELGAAVEIDDADPEENAEALYESLQRLLERNGDLYVLPAHDPGSPDPPVIASLGEVSDRNPDLGLDRSEFVARLSSDIPEQPPNVRRIKRANVGLEEIDDADRSSLELGPNRCAAE